MDKLLKKGLLLGAGLGMIAEEKIQEYLGKLEDLGVLDKKEAKDLAEKLLANKGKESKKLLKDVDKHVGNTLKSAGLVRQSDYAKLMKKVEKLEKALAIKKKSASKKTPKKRKG